MYISVDEPSQPPPENVWLQSVMARSGYDSAPETASAACGQADRLLGASDADGQGAGDDCGAAAGTEVGTEAARRHAGRAIAAMCAVGEYATALEGCQLFLPGCPLEGCLRFLQASLCPSLVEKRLWHCRMHVQGPRTAARGGFLKPCLA